MDSREDFINTVKRWVAGEGNIKSAVLFGSNARANASEWGVGEGPDLDLHIVANNNRFLRKVLEGQKMERAKLCFDISRPISVGVRRSVLIFDSGQLDLVTVSRGIMYAARVGYALGLHRRIVALRVALNEMASCLHGGFKFWKGESSWGRFYSNVAELPGVRIDDEQVICLAKIALFDTLWILQKLQRGERIAALHVLCSRVLDVELRLWRELRIRRELPLPSFGLGRKWEIVADSSDMESVAVERLASVEEVEFAARRMLNGLVRIVGDLVPGWCIPADMANLLERTGPSSLQR